MIHSTLGSRCIWLHCCPTTGERRIITGEGEKLPFVMSQGLPRPLDLGAMASVLGMLPDLKSTNGLCVIVELRNASETGQRPMTMGEAHDFLIHNRGISPAGAKKTLRRLIQLKLVIPAPSPCIDNAKDLLAGRRLANIIPVIAKPYTIYRKSDEGDLERKKFDTAYLDPERLDPADSYLAQWLNLWRSLKPSPDELPRSLTPFFRSPLASRKSPAITGVISVAAAKSGDYEILLCDGPAREDVAFMRGAQSVFLRRFRYKSWARALKADFEQSKLLSQPLFHHLRGKIASHPHDYFRLVLPIASDGTNIDCLITIAELTKDRAPLRSDNADAQRSE